MQIDAAEKLQETSINKQSLSMPNMYKYADIYTLSCPSWQWHRTGSRWFPVRTLLVAPLWCDLGFFPNCRGNKAVANLRPTQIRSISAPNMHELEICIDMYCWNMKYT